MLNASRRLPHSIRFLGRAVTPTRLSSAPRARVLFLTETNRAISPIAAVSTQKSSFSTSAVLNRQQHHEFEDSGPFSEDRDIDSLEHEKDEMIDRDEYEFEGDEEDLEEVIPFDDYMYPGPAGRPQPKNAQIKLTGNTRNRKKNQSHNFYETENNMVYVDGNTNEVLEGIKHADWEYISPEGGLLLERLSSSGTYNDPILPVDYVPYELPYSVEGYRNRQRVFEGFDPDASNPTSQFTDVKIVQLESGKGGNGRVSFFRDAGRSKGPPDGGDGGDGGSVYIQAIEGETSLHKIRFHYKAEDGRPGAASQLHGRTGKDLLLQVPVGTVVKWIPHPKVTSQEWDAHQEELKNKRFGDPKEKNIEQSVSRKDIDQGILLDDLDLDESENIIKEEQKDTTFWKNGKMFVGVPVVLDKYYPQPLGIKLHREVYKDGEGWLFKDKGEEYHLERDYFLRLRGRVKRFDKSLRAEEEREDYFPLDGLDLNKTGPPILMFRGGKGGLGNMHFLTQTIRNPRFSKKGRGGTGGFFLLELKLLADLGLVGLPNAGKSTLLRAISKARPRVGHWEFTTLKPTIGTIDMGISQPSFTVADIPGIVKGARRENRGMGLDFLRHIERSGGLVFVISLEQKPIKNFDEISDTISEEELDKHINKVAHDENNMNSSVNDLEILVDEVGPEKMEGKKVLVVATKADLEGSEGRYKVLEKYCKERGWTVVPCCAKLKGNVEQVIQQMAKISHKY